MNNNLNIKAMENLQLDRKTAMKLYPETPNWFQSILKTTFGEDVAKKRVYTNIKVYEDAVEILPVHEDDIIYPTDRPHIVVFKELCHISRVMNWLQDYKADYNNSNQPKWYQVFKSSGSGFVFSDSSTHYHYTDTNVGSRFALATKESSNYFATQFIDKHNILLKINY